MKKSLVVMFHEINDSDWFDNVAAFFKKHYIMCGTDALAGNHSPNNKDKGFCHFSFDDGHKSFAKNALPVLIKHQIPVSLFISPKIVRENDLFWFQKVKLLKRYGFTQFVQRRCSPDFPHFDLSSYSASAILKCYEINSINMIIKEFCKTTEVQFPQNININCLDLEQILNSDLVEIGAHTMNHPILANESDESARAEIIDSITQVYELTHRKVVSFACPNGLPELDFGLREKQILVKSGISTNFTTITDYYSDRFDSMSIPRIGVTKGSTTFIAAKIMFAKPWVYYRKEIMQNSEINQRRRLLLKFRKPNEGCNV